MNPFNNLYCEVNGPEEAIAIISDVLSVFHSDFVYPASVGDRSDISNGLSFNFGTPYVGQVTFRYHPYTKIRRLTIDVDNSRNQNAEAEANKMFGKISEYLRRSHKGIAEIEPEVGLKDLIVREVKKVLQK